MNELQMISAMLEEDPSERTVAEGRARLLAEVASPASAPAPARRRGLRLPRLGFGLAGLAGVAAAAVAVAVAVSGTAPGDPDPEAKAPRDLSARTVLLAAADRAATTPVARGDYWRVKRMYAIAVRVGPKGRPYTMERLHVVEEWTNAKGVTWSGFREAGARPKTPADAAAWKADGSPARWDLGAADTVQGGRSYLHGTPQPGRVVKVNPPHGFVVAERRMTLKEIQALPSDPERLSAALRAAAGGRNVPDTLLGGALTDLLATVPAPPEVRAAAFRALAALPGARSLGEVKDPQGRTGVGIDIVDRGLATRLIVDPRTSLILSSAEVAGRPGAAKPDKERTTVYLQAGWTDARPQVPTLP